MALIEVSGLTKLFGGVAAIEELSFQVEPGEVVGLLGPNGAGKTTTIRLLAGMIAPTRGYAVVAGLRTDREAERVHEVVGLLTESPGFYERLSARRNLEFFASFYPIDAPAQVEKHLRLVGLWDRRRDRVGTFSKGMKQRLALARALLHEPKVLFLDEPTAGLDPQVAQGVRLLIRQLSREGRTILLSTHNLAEAEMLCQRIAVIRSRLLVLDSAEELRRRLFHREVVVLLEGEAEGVAAAVSRLPFVREVHREEGQLAVVLEEPEKNRPDLVKAIVEAGGRVLGVSEKEHPLEEIYLKLVSEEKP